MLFFNVALVDCPALDLLVVEYLVVETYFV